MPIGKDNHLKARQIFTFKMKKTTRAKKTNTPIPKAGAKSVDPLLGVKKAIEAKLMSSKEDIKAEVDA